MSNKKRTKKYNPKKIAQCMNMDLRGRGLSGEKVSKDLTSGSFNMLLLRNSKAFLSENDVNIALAPMQEFYDAVLNGSCNINMYLKFMDSCYLAARLADELLNLERLSEDDGTNLLAKMTIKEKANKSIETQSAALVSIGERYKKTGKLGVNSNERAAIESAIATYKENLKICNYSVYYRARDKAERYLLKAYNR